MIALALQILGALLLVAGCAVVSVPLGLLCAGAVLLGAGLVIDG